MRAPACPPPLPSCGLPGQPIALLTPPSARCLSDQRSARARSAPQRRPAAQPKADSALRPHPRPMAARLAALASKAKSAAEPLWTRARTEAVKNYDSLMASNAQYVVKDKEVADKLFKQLVFTNLAK